MSGSLEDAKSILEELIESSSTSEQATPSGYRWVCSYCSQPTTEHDDTCVVKRAQDWLSQAKEI
jgi:hypothetical protein